MGRLCAFINNNHWDLNGECFEQIMKKDIGLDFYLIWLCHFRIDVYSASSSAGKRSILLSSRLLRCVLMISLCDEFCFIKKRFIMNVIIIKTIWLH